MRPPFITVEGIDGAGKSSHMETLTRALNDLGFEVVSTKEPGGTPLGERLRMELKTTEMAVQTEVFVAFASRSEHLAQVIRPALAAGKAVISDRFTDSTFAYQGAGKGYPYDQLLALEDQVHGDLTPDLTLWFDIKAGVAERRRESRAASEAPQEAADKFDLAGTDFMNRARSGFLWRMEREPQRFAHIDAGKTFAEVAAQVQAVVGGFVSRYRQDHQTTADVVANTVARQMDPMYKALGVDASGKPRRRGGP